MCTFFVSHLTYFFSDVPFFAHSLSSSTTYWLTELTNRTDPNGPEVRTGDYCREAFVSFLYIFTQPRRK